MGYFGRILYFFIGFSLVYLEQILDQLFLGGGSPFELSDEMHGINVLTRTTALYPDPPPLRPRWQKNLDRWIEAVTCNLCAAWRHQSQVISRMQGA